MANLTITAADVSFASNPNLPHEIVSAPAAEAISAGQFVRFDSNGKLALGNATTGAEARKGGIALKTVIAGERLEALRSGYLEMGTGIDGLAQDANVYLSDTDGTLADTPGTIALVVGTIVPGWAETTADKLLRVNLGDGVLRGSRQKLINGGNDGNHTVAGISVGDELTFVGHISTAAAIDTIADLTSEFTITAANTINNADGTTTTNDQLWVFWNDLT